MFERGAAAWSETTDSRDFSDVLSETAIERQNRWTAERNAQRRELMNRDVGSTRWGRAGERSKR